MRAKSYTARIVPLVSRKLRAAGWQNVLALLDRCPVRRSRKGGPAHLTVGRDGEEAALFYLRKLGYTVVARDWRSGRAPGDLDLVAWEGDTVCFVEVKTRSSRSMAAAEASIDAHKRDTLRRLARHYLRQLPDGISSRFDVVSLYLQAGEPARKGDFELFRNAFGWEERR